MQIVDFHLHSKYSRACSKNLDIDNLEKWGRIKGLDILSSCDFTHPIWIKELKSKLKENSTGEKGIFNTSSGFRFILSTEISLVYTDFGKGRRIHLIVTAPDFGCVSQITEYLLSKGRIDYDGRPIFKIPASEFVYEMKKISNDIEVIPAHCMTPWFGVFGSKSGYDSLKECFKDQLKHIHALETGLSADPSMLYRVKEWRDYAFVSNSDSHSFWPWRLGREATIFHMKNISYDNFIKSIREKNIGTVEVDPNYGIYHYTGHRNCGIVMSPQEAAKVNNVCPVCHNIMTVGVDARIEMLADKPAGFYPENGQRYYKMLPLSELIAGLHRTSMASKKTWEIFNALIKAFKNEYNILLNVSYDDLIKVADKQLADLIIMNREGKIKVKPGFDGIYGVAMIHGDEKYNMSRVGSETSDKPEAKENVEKLKTKLAKQKTENINQPSLSKFF